MASGPTSSVQAQAALTISVSPSSVIIDVAQSQVFTANASGGSSGHCYQYKWYLNGIPVSTARLPAEPNWEFTPALPGPYTVSVRVTDCIGTQATSNSANVKVNSQLSLSVSPSFINRYYESVLTPNQSLTFTANATGGTPPYHYRWYLVPAYHITLVGYQPVKEFVPWKWTLVSTDRTYNFTASEYGVVLYVNVTDSVGEHSPLFGIPDVMPSTGQAREPISARESISESTLGWYAMIDVLPIGSYFAITSPRYAFLNVGQSQTFTARVTGGVPPYSIWWYWNSTTGGLGKGTEGSIFTFAATSPVVLTMLVEVFDSKGTLTSTNPTVVVSATPLSVSILSNSAVMNIGQSQTFTANATGGFSSPWGNPIVSYLYQWRVNGVPVSGATAKDWIFMPPSTGNYAVDVKAVDAAGDTAASNTVTITVKSETSTIISCTLNPIGVNSDTTCYARVEGDLPNGTITFSTSSTTGRFVPADGKCHLASGSCSIAYTDTEPGTANVEAQYSGDSQNTASSGNFALQVEPRSATATTVGIGAIPELPNQLIVATAFTILLVASYLLIKLSRPSANPRYWSREKTDTRFYDGAQGCTRPTGFAPC